MTATNSSGAFFEIQIDGISRTWRDVEAHAYEAARLLKLRNLGARVTVVDLRTGAETPVEVTP